MRIQLVTALLLCSANAGSPAAQMYVPELVVVLRGSLPTASDDPAWSTARILVKRMIPQAPVEPRQLQPTTTEVRVQAVSDGVRVAWADAPPDDRQKPVRLADTGSVQCSSRAAGRRRDWTPARSRAALRAHATRSERSRPPHCG